MRYKVTLRDVAAEDFGVLDGDVQRQAIKQLNKLKQSPELGSDLGHKMGVDLSGYRSLHFYKNQYRILQEPIPDCVQSSRRSEGSRGLGYCQAGRRRSLQDG
jgi:hypothetical protein